MNADPITASVLVDAEPEDVYEFFIRPESMVLWMGQQAHLDPRPGGRFAVDIDGSLVRGRFVEVDAPHLIIVTWGFAGSAVLPPGTSTVEVRFTSEGTGTRVEITHRDLPGDQPTGHAQGWPRFLAALQQTAVRGTDQSEAIVSPADRFEELVESFAAVPLVKVPGEGVGFGSGALRVNGKIFAMLVREALVVKLPLQRVDELVTAGDGARFDANKGKPMKQWLRLDPQSHLDWAELAREALQFVSESRRAVR